MRAIEEKIDQSAFHEPPPRRLPLAVPLGLLLRYLKHNLLDTVLDPVLFGCIIGLAMIVLIGSVPWLLSLLLVGIFVLRVTQTLWKLGFHMHETYTLLREGVVSEARIIKLRPHRDPVTRRVVVLVDCAISVRERSLIAGSAWLDRPDQALKLQERGVVRVLCLQKPPGTWLLLDAESADLRYYPVTIMNERVSRNGAGPTTYQTVPSSHQDQAS